MKALIRASIIRVAQFSPMIIRRRLCFQRTRVISIGTDIDVTLKDGLGDRAVTGLRVNSRARSIVPRGILRLSRDSQIH